MLDIKHIISTLRLTQKELAEAIGYSEYYINRVVNGQNPMNDKLEAKIRKAYPDYFGNGKKDQVRIIPESEFIEIDYLQGEHALFFSFWGKLGKLVQKKDAGQQTKRLFRSFKP